MIFSIVAEFVGDGYSVGLDYCIYEVDEGFDYCLIHAAWQLVTNDCWKVGSFNCKCQRKDNSAVKWFLFVWLTKL